MYWNTPADLQKDMIIHAYAFRKDDKNVFMVIKNNVICIKAIFKRYGKASSLRFAGQQSV